jgi:hypothetical protein
MIVATIFGFIFQIRVMRKVRARRRSAHRSVFSPLRLVDPLMTTEFYLLLLMILLGYIFSRVVFQWAV